MRECNLSSQPSLTALLALPTEGPLKPRLASASSLGDPQALQPCWHYVPQLFSACALPVCYLGVDLSLYVPAWSCGQHPLCFPPGPPFTCPVLSPKNSKLRFNVSPQFRGLTRMGPFLLGIADAEGVFPSLLWDFVHQDSTKTSKSQPPLALIEAM